MAFVQQQKRPRYNRYKSISTVEESFKQQQQQQQQHRQHQEQEEPTFLQHTYRDNLLTTVSDSDTDWHVISSTSQSSNVTSPILFGSSSEASVRLISDISEDEASSIEQRQQQQQTNTFLPSHDGTGTFLNELDQQLTTSDSFDEAHEFATVVNRLMLHFTNTDEEQEQENLKKRSEESTADFTLPFAGIRPPSFIRMNVDPPNFIPTTAGLNSQELTNGVLSGEGQFLSDENVTKEKKKYHNDIKFILKDSVPTTTTTTTGSTGGFSAALLSIIWKNLKRLRDHLIENDSNTAETLNDLMSEAMLEGCIPFSSHLHMEFDNTLRSSTSYSFFDGNIAI